MSNSFCCILARTCFKICIGSVVFVSSIAFVMISYAFVTMKFWNWFLLDIFENAPEITLIQAIGLAFILKITIHRKDKFIDFKKDMAFLNDQSKLFKIWNSIAILVTPWIILFFGWLFKYLCM